MSHVENHILVTGATGTLGKVVIEKILKDFPSFYITGISRDEQKQRLMPRHERLTMRLADIRDENSLHQALDYHLKDYLLIFHLAALKCVDSIEENAAEAIRTNVSGTENIIDLGKNLGANVVLASTDKAVHAINTYGMTKALAERLVLKASPLNIVCRYGNVLGSRGSFLESLKKSLIENQKAYITDERMTRFWMTLHQARDFVIHCAFNGKTGLQIPFYIKSSPIIQLIEVTAEVLGVKEYEIEKVGIRPGEKIHEILCNEFERDENKTFSSDDPDRLMSRDELKTLVQEALAI